jgi:hypothetical protein
MAVSQRVADHPLTGGLLFIRYAFAPNQLGYCGPADSGALLDYGRAGIVDRGLSELASQFSGAWPYLELIAGATGINEPLDRRVVEAYWVGNSLLDRVGVNALGNSMEERFHRRTGKEFSYLAENALAGAVPHHSYHVFGVYPWVGLLSDDRKAPTALRVLDRCRIRWGQVEAVYADTVRVRSTPLTWDGRYLSLGEPTSETATRAVDGRGFLTDLGVGDWVSLHWDWVCDRLDRRTLANLRHYSARQLKITNHEVTHPGPAMRLG